MADNSWRKIFKKAFERLEQIELYFYCQILPRLFLISERIFLSFNLRSLLAFVGLVFIRFFESQELELCGFLFGPEQFAGFVPDSVLHQHLKKDKNLC